MSAAAERVEFVERLWAAVRDCKRKGECVVTLNFETVRTAATLLEAIDRLTLPAEPTSDDLREELSEVTEVAKGCAKREAKYFEDAKALTVALKRVKILLCHATSRNGGMSQQYERKKAREAVDVVDEALAMLERGRG